MIKEIKANIDVQKLRDDLNEVGRIFDLKHQICLQGVEKDGDPYLGVGQDGGKESWKRKQKHNYSGKDFKIPLFDIPYINGLMDELKMWHTRVMYLEPKRCYSYHKDRTKRIHFIVDTNEDCLMIIEKQVYHMPVNGSYFITDTTKMHTAVNASSQGRTHIVGAIGD